ncbi:MAG: flagellin [Pontibacterium sp.]
MAMVINSNVMSMTAQRNLASAVNEQNDTMERLTSGKRINSAADDAAGLAIASRMTSQIQGLDQAVRNANDGISMIQTAEGALEESTNILQRMRELSVQSANGTYTEGNRATLNAEVEQLVEELDRIAETTEYNGLAILSGDVGEVSLQVGSESGQTIDFEIQNMDSKTLGLGSTSLDITGGENSLVGDTTALGHNDVMINGQSIIASGDTWTGGTDDMDELITAINDNVNGVTATTVVSATADDVGDGVLAEGDVFQITVNNLDDTTKNIQVTDTKNLQELADKLNEAGDGTISASIDDDGKLTISAEGVEGFTFTDVTSASGTMNTATASIALSSDNGEEITIERGVNGTLADLESMGFRESQKSGVIEGAAVDANEFAIGDLEINGVDVGVSETGGLADKVDAINSVSDETGVTANAFTSTTLDFSSVDVGSLTGGDIAVNGVDLTISATTMEGLATEFNSITDETGITASVLGTTLVLEGDVSAISLTAGSAAGDEPEAALTDGTTAATFDGTLLAAASDQTAEGGIKLTSDSGNAISVKHANAAAEAKSGLLDANSAADGKYGASVDSIDISTAAGATKAIDVIDNALDTINEVRGELGAVNNRLDFTINNLSNVSENATAALSQIEDADYAAESANLSRAQVLQQAGTAMLAQANAAPQQVLSLLQ